MSVQEFSSHTVNSLYFSAVLRWNHALKIVEADKTTTGHISSNTRGYTTILITEPLVVVGIVDNTKDLTACVPTEGSLARDTPHLVTTIYFRDAHTTLRTRFGFLSDKSRSGFRIFITSMRSITIFTLDSKAL
jgi:hypothetical protein